MKIQSFTAIDQIDAAQWNALLCDRHPFLRHEFLAAMERCGCVGMRAGWIPRHLGCFEGDALIGALPLYEKHNSWGEFVFDHAWAQAYHRAGLTYYPKLVNAVPFTPASGPRILAAPGRFAQIADALINGAHQLMHAGEFSGLHSLFVAKNQFDALNMRDAVTRNDCQFHWHNRDYQNFDAFLDALKAKKRKNIRHERAKVARAALTIHRLDGASAEPRDWRDFCAMYHGIYQRKFGAPAFNLAFFEEIARLMPDQIQLVIARCGERAVGAALMYLDDHTLYGRHWGCNAQIECLHFELCYYQGIEICLARGLKRFDPGAQGEHKIARGFAPTRTQSLHWVGGAFAAAIRQFAEQERAHISRYIDAARQHLPYRSELCCSE